MQEVDWKALCQQQQDTIDALDTAYKTLLETYKMAIQSKSYIPNEAYVPTVYERERYCFAEIKRLEEKRDEALFYATDIKNWAGLSLNDISKEIVRILGEP